MNKFLLIDGHSLLFRAFFAIPFLSTSEGTPTNALYGFLRMLFNVIDQEHPDAVMVAFDAPGPTFRHESFEAYKANREAAPDDLRAQVPLLHRLLDDLGLAHVEVPGFEADDIIGSLSKEAEDAGWKTLIVTGDLDALQLVSDSIEVLVNNRGVTEVTRYTPEAVKEKMGVAPEQVVDVKALKGDTSDNIPGVPGIGDKTAATLIQQFYSIENLLEHLDAVKRPSHREALDQNRETVLRNKELVTITRDMDLTPHWDQWRWERPAPERLRDIFEPFEFRTLMRELGVVVESDKPAQGSNWRRIVSEENLASLVEEVGKANVCAVHCEYLRHDAITERIAGVALAWGEGQRAYVPLMPAPDSPSSSNEGLFAGGHPGSHVQPERLWQSLADLAVTKIVHDAKRALLAIEQGASTADLLTDWVRPAFSSDVLIQAYLLDPSRQDHPLDELVREWCGKSLPSHQDCEAMACERANALLDLAARLQQELRARDLQPLYEKVERPLIEVLTQMELHGMLLDDEHLRSFGQRLSREIHSLESAIHELAGGPFNIGSPKQLQQILFEKLQLPRGRKTKTGYSTDASVLEKLAQEHDIVRKILDYRELTKLKSTYVDGLLSLMDPLTHRVHTRLKQTGAATGRLASAEPNLQNIPIRTELGREIRRAFIAPPETCRLIAADYSQIELRVLAHIAQDPRLIEAFRHDEDIHTRTAADLFSVGSESVTSEMRRMAKVINFGIAYGMSQYGLAANLDIPPADAQVIIDSYFATFPGVRQYMQDIVQQARESGYVTSLLHRRRYLPDIKSLNRAAREFAERTAINTPIQGSAADIIKLAMIAIHRRLRETRLNARMILQVHDELVFEVPRSETDDLARLVKEEMERAMELIVPLKAEVKLGDNWRDMAAVEDLASQPVRHLDGEPSGS